MKPLTVDPGRVVLFREHNKSNEKAPDLKGACNIDGVQYEVAIWERESKRGVPYLSGVIKPARDQVANAQRTPQDDDLDTAIPPVDDDASERRW
jgi:uncharacterized protein (DUF736 family)